MVVVDVVGESVLVTSDETGRLHGSYNVCRHRGSQIMPGHRPSRLQPVACAASALRCPYHSWTYGLDGRLMRAPHTDLEGLDVDDFRLNPVGVETWGGFVFVHLTPGAGDAARRRRRAGRARRWPTTASTGWSPARR